MNRSWYRPNQKTIPSIPDDTDIGGAPNLLIHNKDLPLTIIDMFPCKGLVQIEKWEGTT